MMRRSILRGALTPLLPGLWELETQHAHQTNLPPFPCHMATLAVVLRRNQSRGGLMELSLFDGGGPRQSFLSHAGSRPVCGCRKVHVSSKPPRASGAVPPACSGLRRELHLQVLITLS